LRRQVGREPVDRVREEPDAAGGDELRHLLPLALDAVRAEQREGGNRRGVRHPARAAAGVPDVREAERERGVTEGQQRHEVVAAEAAAEEQREQAERRRERHDQPLHRRCGAAPLGDREQRERRAEEEQHLRRRSRQPVARFAEDERVVPAVAEHAGDHRRDEADALGERHRRRERAERALLVGEVRD